MEYEKKDSGDEGMKKPGGLAIVIASKMKKKEEGGEDKDGGCKELAGMIIDAVKEGDAEKLAKDLKSFIKMCSMEDKLNG